jgi:uncharacterized protein (DUF885 family)
MSIDRRSLLKSGAAAAAVAALPAWAATPDAKAVLDDITEQFLRFSPESATSLGIDVGARAEMRAQLGDRSPAGQAKLAAFLRQSVKRLDALGPARGLDGDVVRTCFATSLDGFAFPFGDVAVGGWRNTPYVVIQNVGAFLDVPRFLDSEHRVENATDADSYLSRLSSYARQLDGETARLKSASARGMVPPDFLLDKALPQLRASREGAAKGGGLVASLAARTKNIPGDWEARARRVAENDVAPALDRQIAVLTAQRAKAGDSAGIWARPQGDAYYAWALRASTTTRMTPEEVHKMGQEQLRELHGRMEPILASLGYTKGSVGARMSAIGKDPKYAFSEGDKGRAEILTFIQNRLDRIRAQLPRAFGTLTRGNVEVRRLPPEEEPGAPGAYGGPGSIDGTIPGKFWINLRTTALHTKFDLPSLTHHESIPGHVWQGEYAQRGALIRALLAFNAYSEGWALYAEQLGDELGMYDDDPVGRLGYLQSIAFRACRLVVDTGLHAKRWTRAQGVAFFVDVNGSKPEEVRSEVDRYCSWPGQACGYKVGHSEINRLRDLAKVTLGPKYDLRAFDDAVVQGGNVPMTVLDANVRRYMARA